MTSDNAKRGRCGRARRGAGAIMSAAALAGVLLTGPSPASAEVLEVGSDGGITMIQGPGPSAPAAKRGVRPRRAAAAAPPRALLGRAAVETALSPALLEAVAWRESAFRQDARSRAGALGVMQLMPGTARDLGVDPANAAQNVSGGARYLKAMLARYDGDLVRALAAYNAGPRRADRAGAGASYSQETRNYVAAILERLSQEAEGRPAGREDVRR